MILFIYIKQRWGWVEKIVAYKKYVYFRTANVVKKWNIIGKGFLISRQLSITSERAQSSTFG